MIELSTQKFLREYDNPDEALDNLSSLFDLHTNEKGDLVQFNYTYGSPWCNPITRECRSLILERGTWDVVAYPFRRFYNVQEECADTVVPESSVCWEKVDGSLIILYPYKDKWRVATRKCVDGSGSLPYGQKTFKEKFFEIFHRKGYSLPSQCFNFCFMFEIVGPKNRVVTEYEDDLYLVGIRSLLTLNEIHPNMVNNMLGKNDVQIPDSFPFESIDEVVEQKMDDLGKFDEGFVICDYGKRCKDGSFQRVKVKNPHHAKLAKLSYDLSPTTKDMVKVVLEGIDDDIRVIFSGERKEKLEHIENKIQELIDTIQKKIDEIDGNHSSRKELAKMISDFPFRHCIFGLIDGKYETATDAVFSLKPEHISDWIDEN